MLGETPGTSGLCRLGVGALGMEYRLQRSAMADEWSASWTLHWQLHRWITISLGHPVVFFSFACARCVFLAEPLFTVRSSSGHATGFWGRVKHAWRAAQAAAGRALPTTDRALVLTIWRHSRSGFLLAAGALWGFLSLLGSVAIEEKDGSVGIVLAWTLFGVVLGTLLFRWLRWPKVYTYLIPSDDITREELLPWVRSRVQPLAAHMDIPRIVWPVALLVTTIWVVLMGWLTLTGKKLVSVVEPVGLNVFLVACASMLSAGGTCCLSGALHFHRLLRHQTQANGGTLASGSAYVSHLKKQIAYCIERGAGIILQAEGREPLDYNTTDDLNLLSDILEMMIEWLEKRGHADIRKHLDTIT